MSDQFSISRDSIRLPYSRFLADSAAGFLSILFVTAAYYFPIVTNRPIQRILTEANLHPKIGDEVKVFVLIAIFVLATPLGFAINAFSWLTLSQLIAAVEAACYRWSRSCGDARLFPIWYVSAARYTHELSEQFGITASTFAQSSWFLRQVLESRDLSGVNRESQVRGLVILLRNTAFFALSGSGIALYLAAPADQDALVIFVGELLLLVAIAGRWFASSRSARIVLGISGAAAFFAIIYAYHSTWDNALSHKSLLMLILGTIVILVAGMIGYYNCCAVIMHSHFAAAALGASTIAETEALRNTPLGIATALISRAAATSRSVGTVE